MRIAIHLLDLQSQPELDGARTASPESRIHLCHVRSLRNLSERRRPERPLGKCEVGMVEQVEKLRPELQQQRFSETEVLGRGKIQIVETRSINRVAPQISNRTVRRLAETAWVQISARRYPI